MIKFNTAQTLQRDYDGLCILAFNRLQDRVRARRLKVCYTAR